MLEVVNITAVEEEKQILQLVQELNVHHAEKMLAVLDVRGHYGAQLAKLVMPKPLICVTDSSELRSSLEVLERNSFQKRVLVKTESETTAALNLIAGELPSSPEVPEVLMEALSMSTGAGDYEKLIVLEPSKHKPGSLASAAGCEMNPTMFLPTDLSRSQACARLDLLIANSLASPSNKGLFAMRKFDKNDVVMVLAEHLFCRFRACRATFFYA